MYSMYFTINIYKKDGDMTSLYYVAKALLKLQTIVGIIPKIIGKGKCANVIINI